MPKGKNPEFELQSHQTERPDVPAQSPGNPEPPGALPRRHPRCQRPRLEEKDESSRKKLVFRTVKAKSTKKNLLPEVNFALLSEPGSSRFTVFGLAIPPRDPRRPQIPCLLVCFSITLFSSSLSSIFTSTESPTFNPCSHIVYTSCTVSTSFRGKGFDLHF